MRIGIKSIFAMLIILCMMVGTAQSETAVVNTQSSPLSLRDMPKQGGKILFEIKKGETVTVIEGGEWPLVEYNGRQGYVNGKYLEYPEEKYQKAIQDQKNNYFMSALSAFSELGGYKDAAQRVELMKASKLYPMRYNNKYGLINEHKQWVLKPQWDMVGEAQYLDDSQYVYRVFRGEARIQKKDNILGLGKGKYGLINREGKEIIPCIWDDIDGIRDGYILCSNTENEKKEYSMYYYNGVSCEVVAENYSYLELPSCGYILYEKNGKSGYLCLDGRKWRNVEYTNAYSFEEGLACVQIDGKYGYIDVKGNIVIQPKWDEPGRFKYGLTVVKKDDKWGYINKKGELTIEMQQVDRAFVFQDRYGVAILKKNGQQWMIDTKGNMVGKKWDWIGEVDYDGTIIVKKNDKYGFVNTNGDVLVEPKYDSVSHVGGNVLYCDIYNDPCYYTSDGKKLIIGRDLAKKLKSNTLYFSHYSYYDAVICFTNREMVIVDFDGSIFARESTVSIPN